MINLISRRGASASEVAAFIAPLASTMRAALVSRPRESVDTFDREQPPRVTTYCYDARGRLLGVVEPIELETTTFHYDCDARIAWDNDNS